MCPMPESTFHDDPEGFKASVENLRSENAALRAQLAAAEREREEAIAQLAIPPFEHVAAAVKRMEFAEARALAAVEALERQKSAVLWLKEAVAFRDAALAEMRNACSEPIGDDPRMGYVEVQIGRDDWDNLFRPAAAAERCECPEGPAFWGVKSVNEHICSRCGKPARKEE